MNNLPTSLILTILPLFLLIRDIHSYTIAIPNGGQASDYYTFTPNVQYLINATFPTNISITAGSYVTLQFPYQYNITASTLTNCMFSIDTVTYSATNCSVTSTGSGSSTIYTVKFPNVFPSAIANQPGINLALNITNPWGGGNTVNQVISIFLYNSTDNGQGNGQTTMKFWPSIMTGCSYASANLTTGVNSTKIITFTPIVPVLANSYLQVTMPLWFNTMTNAPSGYSCLGVNNSDAGTLICSRQTTSPNQVFTLSGFVTSTKNYSSPIVLRMGPLRNPWSLNPFGPITFQIFNSNIPSQNCSAIYLNMTTPNTFTNINQFDLPSSPTITTNYSVLTLRLTIRQPFPASTGYVMLSYPTTVGMTFVGTASLAGSTNTSITLGGLSGSDLTASGSTINMMNSLTIITPPSSRPFSFTFTSLYFVSGVYYQINTISTTITPVTGTLTNGSVTAVSQYVNDVTAYTIVFVTNNALTTNSYICVVFPSSISIAGSCSSTNSFISCSIINSSYANLTVSGSIPASTNISITFNQVTNPSQAYTTTSIQIYTYWDSGLDSMVDTLTTGLTITTKARPISNVAITPTSLVTYAFTDYAFSMTTLDPIPSGGIIVITFPPTITLGNVSIISASFSTASCNISISGNTVTLSSCFGSTLAAGSHTFNLSKIYNPPSLQPTTTFSIITAGALGNINYINASLTVTMVTPATSLAFSVAPNSQTVHAVTTYNISITFAVPHQSGDYFTFNIDASMAITSLNCTPNSGITSVSCFLYNSSSINITFTATPSTSIQIAVSSITNYDISSTGITYQALLYNSLNYQMETTSITTITYNPDSITSISVNNNQQIALYQNSNITLIISSPFAIRSSFNTSLTSLVITAPAQFTALNNTSCSPSLGNCSFTNLTFTITPIGNSFTNFTVVLGNIKLPYITTTSTSFSIAYKYNNKDIAKVTTGITISPYCTSPCQRCSVNKSYCYSCLPSPNTAIKLFTNNNTCLVNCPNGYYSDTGNNCQPCNTPCLYCLDSVNCTKCIAYNWLYQYTCSPTCPNLYYNDSSGDCLPCVAPCANCTTSSICLTCITNYFYYNKTCVNASSCPSTTFANTTSNKCDPCSSPCVTCLYSSANACLTCINGYLYFPSNNSCLLVCPDTYFNNSGTCTACINPCGNCTSALLCTSCLSNFLDATTSKCVPASSCPTGTIADVGTKTCTTCPIGCSACTSLTNCSGCTGIYLFYKYQCVISCPNSTYQITGTCQNCSSTCLSCSGSAIHCTACSNPSVLYNSTCIANCPSGTYNASGVCQNCLSSCQSCSNGSSCDTCRTGTYLINGLCQTSCPNGYYQDFGTGTCATCDPICTTCSNSSTSCTSCPSPTLYYNNTCIGSCPLNYFAVNGFCLTCGNCVNCSSATTCIQCISGFYLFVGVCYSSCPANGIADPTSMTCTQCDPSCLTCSGATTNCTSCKGGSYLYKSVCFSTCPSGLISNGITNTCEVSTLGNIVYFPCSITFAIWLIIVIYSKHQHTKTEGITSVASGLSLILWFAWLVLIFTAATTDQALSSTSKTAVLGVGMTGVLCSLCLGIAYNIWIKRSFTLDAGFSHWLDHNKYNQNSYRIIVCLSCLTMPFFRMIYSRFFNRRNFSCFFLEGSQFLRGSNWFTFFVIIFCIMPQIFVCGFIIYIKQTYDQTLIYAIDVLLLSLFLLVFLIIDVASKGDQFFDQMLADQPYLKRLKYNDLNQSASCLRFLDQQNKPVYKTDIDQKEKEQFFRMKVTFTQNLNKFGHLSAPMPKPIAPPRKVKTLPDDLENYPQLDPNQDDIVMNEDLFFQQEERRRKIQEEQQAERLRRQQEQRLRRLKEQQEQQKQRRRRRMLEDQDQQHQIQFPDLAAIEKVEQKGKDSKKSPTQLLNNFKKVDDKKINDKALKKLQQVAKKNGLDAQFMAETFGVQKNHNPQLLNAIIDKHNHVNREAVKQLFSSNNNPQVLQTLFAKNSVLDTQKLKELLNNPNSTQIIKKLASAQEGILSPQIAKLLFDKNSKFNEQFVKELLGGDNGMDQKKIKEMLRDNPDKAIRQAALKALKKVGGNNLQNKQILQKMLGQDSKLTTQAFIRVANQLPKSVSDKIFRQKSQTNDLIIQKLINNPKIDLRKLIPVLQNPQVAKQLAKALGKEQDAQTLQRVVSDLPPSVIKQLFGNKSEANDIIIDKVLKNKKIDLKNLAGILSDPALVQQLALALNNQDPTVQQNILNLLKNGQKLSPQLLKQFLSKPDLLKKLLSNPVDPAFLCNLLSEDAKTDFKLLEKALDNMQPEQIAQIFSFNPQKNTDFGKMAKIFEANSKSDPKLIAQLLTPEIVDNIYSKTSFTKAQILNKLVEKGKKIHTDQIIKIYGEDDKPGVGFGARDRDPDRKYNITDKDFKYNNTDNNFNLSKEDQDSEMGFKKQNNVISSMSRTDGVAGFLSPIQIGLSKGKKKGNNLFNVGSIDDIYDDQEITEYNQRQEDQKEQEEEFQVVDGVKRKKKRKLKKKPLDDIRLPSEQIYLQRLQAPHEAKKKNLRKKKKKGSSSMPQLEAMDQDNQVYDLDF